MVVNGLDHSMENFELDVKQTVLYRFYSFNLSYILWAPGYTAVLQMFRIL